MKALSAQEPKVNRLISPPAPVQSLQQNTCSSNSTDTQSDKPSRTYFRSNKVSQKLRLQTITIGPPPPSPAEKLVAQLVGCVMSAEDVNFDASLSRRSCTILPKYMLTSDALCNAVKCMIACYLNHRRGLPAEHLFDLKSYGRALRSLNQSLRDTNNQTSTSTLAAISIIHRAIVRHQDFVRNSVYICLLKCFVRLPTTLVEGTRAVLIYREYMPLWLPKGRLNYKMTCRFH
jgi:hypothetical protein